MAERKQDQDNQGALGSPAEFRQEDVDLLVAGEMPEEVVFRILEGRSQGGRVVSGRKTRKKLAPIELSAQDIELAASSEEVSEALAERLEKAGKRDANRKRAAGTKADVPGVLPPGMKRPMGGTGKSKK
jgi:hypothetical protein